jgi:two-component system NtrC family sensor kinase
MLIGVSCHQKKGATEHHMTATRDDEVAELRRANAELQRRLDARTAELVARNSEFGERIEHQSATIDVLKVMSASPGDPQPVFDLITRRARELCNADTAGLYGFDGELVHILSIHTATDAALTTPGMMAFRRKFPAPPTREINVGRAILGRQIVHIRDVEIDQEVAPFVRDLGVRSHVALPLLRDSTVIGVIGLNAKESGGFSDSQVELLRTFGEQVVITSAETYRQLQQRTGDLQEALEQQTATAELLQVINSSPGALTPVFEDILDKAMRLCGVAFGFLDTFDGERFHTAALRGVPESFVAFRTQNPPEYGPDTTPLQILGGERFVHITDLSATEAYRVSEPNRRAVVDIAGAKTALVVPLLKESTLLGVICVFRREVRPFTNTLSATGIGALLVLGTG